MFLSFPVRGIKGRNYVKVKVENHGCSMPSDSVDNVLVKNET